MGSHVLSVGRDSLSGDIVFAESFVVKKHTYRVGCEWFVVAEFDPSLGGYRLASPLVGFSGSFVSFADASSAFGGESVGATIARYLRKPVWGRVVPGRSVVLRLGVYWCGSEADSFLGRSSAVVLPSVVADRSDVALTFDGRYRGGERMFGVVDVAVARVVSAGDGSAVSVVSYDGVSDSSRSLFRDVIASCERMLLGSLFSSGADSFPSLLRSLSFVVRC